MEQASGCARNQVSGDISNAEAGFSWPIQHTHTGQGDFRPCSTIPPTRIPDERVLFSSNRDQPVGELERVREPMRRLLHDLRQGRADTKAILELVYGLHLTRDQLSLAITRFGLQTKKSKNDTREMAEAKALRIPHGPDRLSSKKRRRPEAWLKALGEGQLVDDLKKEIKHWHSSREPPRIQSPDVYEKMEIMLSNVHSLKNSLFKDPNWSFDRVEMLDPSGSTRGGGSWKRFSDQVWGVSSLFRQGHKYEGSVKLRCLLLEAADTIDPADPQILVRIWRISRYLLGICKSLGNNDIFRKVLTYLRDSMELKTRGGNEDPAVKLLDTLANMDVSYLHWALSIGQQRALQCLEDVIGCGHPVVLSMRIYYCKQWASPYENQGGVVGYYDKALRTADHFCGPESNTALSILHDFTYFVHYSNNKEISPTAAYLASQLWDKTNLAMLSGQNVWSAKTQYFTFASQVLAESCLRQGNAFWATWYIEYAVHLLHQSDRECQVRADMLLARLYRWLRAWGEHDTADAVSARRQVLMKSINGLLSQEIDEFNTRYAEFLRDHRMNELEI